MTISLDCLGKFITYNYVADMEDEVAQTQVMEKVVDGICDCFIGEETDKKVQLQIIKVSLPKKYVKNTIYSIYFFVRLFLTQCIPPVIHFIYQPY